MPEPTTLAAYARAIVLACDPAEKVELAKSAAQAWHHRRLSIGRRAAGAAMPCRPGRPGKPELKPPRDMPRRSTVG
ncbi:MAG: DUF455 domain-containing protein, partial [Methyloligellaceae bacterium]